MGISRFFGVMVSGYIPLILAVVYVMALPASSATFCPQGKQFMSSEQEKCVNCSECAEGDVVLRPCEVHRDTMCGSISDLLKFVQTSGDNNNNHIRHKHRQRHRGNSNNNNNNNNPNSDIVWKYGDDVGKSGTAEGSGNGVTSTEVPFSSAETLVWDWQAVALSVAVFACILFFLAITLYSLHQAKQWRRLKDNFDADVEDLSARLSLMAAAAAAASSGSEKDADGIMVEPHHMISDGNYLNSRCVYLEQLLNVRKDTNKTGSPKRGGNVYIEESTNGKA